MKEYWINVYNDMIYPRFPYNVGKPCDSPVQASQVAYNLNVSLGIKTLYRIHVRLK